MAKQAKVVKFYKERYQGCLTDKDCDTLEYLIETDKCNGYLQDFTHLIYNLSDNVVKEIIEIRDTDIDALLPDYEKPVGTLREYQTTGVGFLYFAKTCILGDSVGLGKTVETAGLIRLLQKVRNDEGNTTPIRYLLLTEKNLVRQVRTEMVKFTGEYADIVTSGDEKAIKKFLSRHPFNEPLSTNICGTHALLTTPAFLSWIEQCRTQGKGFPFDLLVIDESSCLGNTKTQIVTGFKAISKYFERIIFLNATPFETKLDIFYTQLSLLDPTLLPTKTDFTNEYCIIDYTGMFPRPTGKYKNTELFRQRIGYKYFARTRREKGGSMTGCGGRIRYSPLSPIQKEWMQKTQMYRMVYDCPTALDPNIPFNEETVPKLKSLLDLLENECADFDTILFFVYYKEAQELISKWLKTHGISNRVLNGDTETEERSRIITDFKEQSYRILITNVQRGLNFKDCPCCIFYSYDPNPSKMIQFEGRITRTLNIDDKSIYLLCSEGKEAKRLKDVITDRTKSTMETSSTDFSVILDLLMNTNGDAN